MPRPPAPAASSRLEPYRLLFPMGVAFALLGAGVWPLFALGHSEYPGPLHIALMMQGFEQCFVLGFLLTAMPGFTGGPRCHPLELAAAAATMTVFGIAVATGLAVVAQVSFLLSLAVLTVAGIRRVARSERKPPEEFLFVAFGLLLGIIGGALLLAAAYGAAPAFPYRFAERLLSLGMVLSLVIGVGSLLVPTFAGIRDPLVIQGVAGPHERGGRRALYLIVIAALGLAFVAELAGRPRLGMVVRAGAITAMGLWVWKLSRLPRRDVPGLILWGSGWMVMAGLWAAALFPLYAIAGLHATFIGGFALLTVGIATRVAVAHGKHPATIERRVLDPWVPGLLLLALAVRILADLLPARANHALGASSLVWMIAWVLWSARALPLIVRRGAPQGLKGWRESSPALPDRAD